MLQAGLSVRDCNRPSCTTVCDATYANVLEFDWFGTNIPYDDSRLTMFTFRTTKALVLASLGLFLAQSAPVSATVWESCERNASYLPWFDDRLSPAPCELIHTFPIDTPTGRRRVNIIRVTGSAHGDDTRWTAAIESAANISASKLSLLGELNTSDITVLLTPLQESLDAHATTNAGLSRNYLRARAAREGEGECAVTFYKTADAIAEPEFAFTFAHEFFHCAQASTWTDGYFDRSSTWWVEGSAEYFANLVFPGTDYSRNYISSYDRKSLNTSILDLDYENVLFFLWLGDTQGPSAISALIGSMPASGGRNGQLRALQTTLPLESWHEFAQAALDGQVKNPDGSDIPALQSVSGVVAVGSATTISLAGPAYSIPRRALLFRRGKAYPLTVQNQVGGFELRMKPERGASTWDKPPTEVLACDEDKPYLLYGAGIQNEGSVELRVSEPRTVNTRVCCLIGTWKPTEPTVLAHSRSSQAIASQMQRPSLTCSFGGGGWRLIFFEDGSGQWRWESFANVCEMPGRGGSMRTTTTSSGFFDFDWTLSDTPGRGTYTIVDNQASTTVQVSIGPVSARPMTGPITPILNSGELHFQCRNNSLTITGFAGAGGHNDDTYVKSESEAEPEN
jgi:hypothetical protein